jgi:pyruvate dehydrogenase E2 component (dihydrolipoamide acetyltransferase)
LARRLAHEAGLSIDQLTGTGPNGRILRRDVERAQAAPRPAAAAAPQRPAQPAAFTDVPHTKLRRLIAARLTESTQTAPHFYLRGSARVDRLLELREELNDGVHARVSINDLVVKAVAQAHLLVPAMNVTWGEDAVRSYASVDVAVAVATEHGLVTPVLRSVEQMTVTAVATAVQDVVERARAGRLQQPELEGGSISVTNLGMYGTEEFAAIINPPQAAILAVGAAREEPVVVDGALQVGQVMRVTLSVDHRPVDGVVAAQWMRAFVDLLEHPARILA